MGNLGILELGPMFCWYQKLFREGKESASEMLHAGSRETRQVHSCFICLAESYSNFIFLSPGSFQKVTGDVSDITQMAVSRYLHFWNAGYITVINAFAL